MFFEGCKGLFGVFQGVYEFICCLRGYLMFFKGLKELFGVFRGVQGFIYCF